MKNKKSLVIFPIIIIMICVLSGCKKQVDTKNITTNYYVTDNNRESKKETTSKSETTLDKETTEYKETTSEKKTTEVKETTTKKETTVNKETKNHEETTKNNVTPAKGIKKLHVSGTKLVDDKGNIVQLKGISTHGISWFPQYINEKCFKYFHDKGADIIRLALYPDEYNGYSTGGNKNELKQYVKNGVEYAAKNNMYVIIDWHVHGEGNPNIHKEDAKEFFKEMASTYKDYNNVFYEICNEPCNGTTWSDIKKYAEEIIPVIRKYDKDGVIIVGTPNWSQYVNEAAANPVKGYDNIMYTLHFYAGTHKEELRNTMVNAIKAGLPVFVTEYGICDASGNGAIDEYQAGEWVKTMDKYNISYVMWNLSNKSETSAVLNNWCNKVEGFTDEDLSPAGKWLIKQLAK